MASLKELHDEFMATHSKFDMAGSIVFRKKLVDLGYQRIDVFTGLLNSDPGLRSALDALRVHPEYRERFLLAGGYLYFSDDEVAMYFKLARGS